MADDVPEGLLVGHVPRPLGGLTSRPRGRGRSRRGSDPRTAGGAASSGLSVQWTTTGPARSTAPPPRSSLPPIDFRSMGRPVVSVPLSCLFLLFQRPCPT